MSDKSSRPAWSITAPAVVGLLALAILVLGLGIWSVRTELAGAIISQGVIEVQSNRQVIEHPDGGVVGEIFVRDGDSVTEGELMLRLDDTFLASETTIVESQLFELLARKARLEAERDGADNDALAQSLQELKSNETIGDDLLAGQQRLFNARLDTLTQQIDQLGKQKVQIENEIEGIQAQLASLNTQVELIRTELEDQQGLLQRGELSAAHGVAALVALRVVARLSIAVVVERSRHPHSARLPGNEALRKARRRVPIIR